MEGELKPTIFVERASRDLLLSFHDLVPGTFASVVNSLKHWLPVSLRSFDKGRKSWRVKSQAEARLNEWLDHVGRNYGVEVVRLFGEGHAASENAPSSCSSPGEAFAVLHLLPTAPPSVIKAAYRALSLETHPDRGGDSEQMVALNLAFERLQRSG